MKITVVDRFGNQAYEGDPIEYTPEARRTLEEALPKIDHVFRTLYQAFGLDEELFNGPYTIVEVDE